jgi:hypothetical protein
MNNSKKTKHSAIINILSKSITEKIKNKKSFIEDQKKTLFLDSDLRGRRNTSIVSYNKTGFTPVS